MSENKVSESANNQAAENTVEDALQAQEEAIHKEAEELKNNIEKLKKDYLYLRAEFDNFRRNAAREHNELRKFGAEQIIIALLEVIDNFDRALQIKLAPETMESYRQGIEMIAKDLKGVLKKFGVEEVNSLHQAFDPSMHEALSSLETDEVKPGYIAQVYKKPYTFHDKIVRAGQVIVAKEKSK